MAVLIDKALGKAGRYARSSLLSCGQRAVIAFWANSAQGSRNWGDKLNPVLIRELAARKVYHKDEVSLWPQMPVYFVIGSMISNADSRSTIWGAGFIRHMQTLKAPPKQVCAVRGPLTRERLLELGIECPERYGDPALLYPILYRPSIRPENKLGFIQHFRERGIVPLPSLVKQPDVMVVDITDTIEKVVDQICSCEVIVSSSLHGIIAAHAYGVPAIWMKCSELPLGDGFKFQDYFASMGWRDAEPIAVNEDSSLDELIERQWFPRERVDVLSLLYACPFIDHARKLELARTVNRVYHRA